MKGKDNKNFIGVYDSGVGGLSILLELRKLLPKENFVFIADQKYVPYGEKSKKELIKRGIKITDYFLNKYKIKMMVIACNTATCGAVEALREKYSLPIVGTVPAVKLAASKTKAKSIAVISTPFTSKSFVLKSLIKDYCQNIEVLNVGCKNLENLVEKGDLKSGEVQILLMKYLKEIKSSKIDYLVLGCTHYPFLKKSISKILGSGIHLLDSGKAISRRTKSLLVNSNLQNKNMGKGKYVFITTGDNVLFSKVASKLLNTRVLAKKVEI